MIVFKNVSSLFLLLVLPLSGLWSQGETCNTASVIAAPGTFTADGPSSGNGCYNCSPGTPGGIPAINADWYSYTPSSDGLLSITSCNGGADTRLWVYSGDCNNLTLLASNDDFCDFAPQEPYAAAINNLAVTGGVTLFLEWDDAWDTQGFTFELSLEPLSENLRLDGWPIPFTALPAQQLENGIPIPVNVINQGTMVAVDVQVATEIWDADTNMPIDTFFTDSFSLNAGENKGFLMGPLTGIGNGRYFLLQKLLYQGPDDMSTDNSYQSEVFAITSNEFATDDGNFDGGIGVAGPGVFYLGQFFEMYATDTIRSVRFNITGGNTGDTLVAFIYSYNGFTGSPQDLILESRPQILNASGADWLEIPFNTPLAVEAGEKYFFGLAHHATGAALNLGVTPNIFKPNNGWFALDNPDWVPIEALNSSGGTEYNLAFAIRPVTDLNQVMVEFSVDMREQNIAPDGVWLEVGDLIGPIGAIPLDAQGNGIYSGALPLIPFTDVYYVFSNGFPLTGGDREMVPQECSVPGFLQLRTRLLTTGSTDMQIPKVCFSACTVCQPEPCTDPDFLICDDVEYYNIGDVTPQAPYWDVWSANSDGAIVTNTRASSGNQSLRIDGNLSGLSQDVLLQLDNQASGKFTLTFDLYVPAGKSAYFGLLHQRNPEAYGWDIYLDRQDKGYIYQGSEELASFDFQEDTWMNFNWEIDLENDFNALKLDGNVLWSGQFSLATDINGDVLPNNLALASINFYPFDNLYEFYLDEIYFHKETVQLGDHCFGALSLDDLFGQPFGIPQISAGYSNIDFTTDSGDALNGNDCFTEQSNPWQQTIWFSFMGDGSTYEISALTDPNGPCGIQQSFTGGDAQFAIYQGDCNNLMPVACSENENIALAPSTILETEIGTQYYLILDGTDIYSSLPEGEFCMQVTNIEPTVEATIYVDMGHFIAHGGIISNEGVLIGGSVVDGVLLQMQDNGNGTYSSTIPLPQNKSYDYRFYNGTNEPEKLDFLADCLEPDSLQGRLLAITTNDIELDTVCFEYCFACDSLSSTQNIFAQNSISLSPNPLREKTTISVVSNGIADKGQLRVINSMGQQLIMVPTVQLPYELDCHDLPNGMYWVEYRNENGKISIPLVIGR
ncbi:MAG: T9SS type A sorting domain-containing protein [Saprospiraceae bacterium]|nr:T9SS type A sorting domain-containing protein [Saprospiraceae bacterium]